MANCDEIITGGGSITLATSAVTVYDGGSLGCVTVPSSPSLNDVLEALAVTVCAISAPYPPSSTVIMDADLTSCAISVTVGMTLNTALTNMITKICNNNTLVSNIYTNGCSEIAAAGCSCADFTDAYWSIVTPAVLNPPVTLADVLCNMTKGIEFNYTTFNTTLTNNKEWRKNAVRNFIYFDVATYGNLSVNVGVLTYNVAETKFGFEGDEITIPVKTDLPGLTATRDNYIDYDGTAAASFTNYVITPVVVGASAPPKAVNSIRLGYITTDGVGGISVTALKEIQSIDTLNIKDSAVTTAKVTDLAVTTAKLSLTGVAASATDIANVTVGVDGRITAIDSDFNISGPTDGQIITYNFASSKWVNTTQQQLPSGSADDEMLIWDNVGSTWDVQSFNIRAALDVNAPSITDTQVLSWDTATSKFVAADKIDPIVIYVVDETELLAAFDTFNAAPARAGIIKMGANITLTADRTLDFGIGIEVWGGNNQLIVGSLSDYGITTATTTDKLVQSGQNFISTVTAGDRVDNITDSTSTTVDGVDSNTTLTLDDDIMTSGEAYVISKKFLITVNGTQGIFRNVNFVGYADFAMATSNDSQHFLDFDDSSLLLFTLSECYFTNVVGSSSFSGTAAYPITVSDVNNSFWLELHYAKIGTTRTGTGVKPYDSFRVKYSAGANDAFKITCRDWTNYAPADEVTASRWQESKDSMKVIVDITGSPPLHKRGFYYDETTTFDTTSTFAMDLFPTFWGPTTRVMSGVNPKTGVAQFGNPGDMIMGGTATETLFVKHTAIGTDNNWLELT